MSIYLDNSATTRVYDEVINEVIDVLKNKNHNPSSAYKEGLASEKLLKNSRLEIANIINSSPDELYFTSGGSESNNTAIKGIAIANKNKGNKIISSPIEHDSVTQTLSQLEGEFVIENVCFNSKGEIDLEKFSNMINRDLILVTLMHTNNEIGIINPIEKIGKIVKEKNSLAYFHVDAVQSFLKLKIDVKNEHENVDLLSASAHKIHGPKGVGFIYVRNNTKIIPLICGGGQENGLRSGTENVAGIVGFAKACSMQNKTYIDEYKEINKKKDYLKEKIINNIPDVSINSVENGASHILNVSFLGVGGEILLHSLEKDNILVSTGSACSSKKKGSRVLKNIGLSKERMASAIRFSFSNEITYGELDFVVEKLQQNVKEIRKISKYKVRG